MFLIGTHLDSQGMIFSSPPSYWWREKVHPGKNCLLLLLGCPNSRRQITPWYTGRVLRWCMGAPSAFHIHGLGQAVVPCNRPSLHQRRITTLKLKKKKKRVLITVYYNVVLIPNWLCFNSIIYIIIPTILEKMVLGTLCSLQRKKNVQITFSIFNYKLVLLLVIWSLILMRKKINTFHAICNSNQY